MSQLVVYLDTNHVSDIARDPGHRERRAVLGLLQSGRVRLSMSLIHFVELASADVKITSAIKQMLSDVPVAWALSTEEVWDSEIAVACARAVGKTRGPPRVFCETALDWSRGPTPTPGSAVEFLEVMIDQPGLRVDLLRIADEAARVSMMKTKAALITRPDLPLQLSVASHLEDFRTRNWDYGGGLEAGEVIRLVGGSRAFPSLDLYHATIGQRLRQVAQKSTRNDVFDEYHASYAPYSAATALDRGAAARVRSAGLADRHRVTARLADVPGLVECAQNGNSPPEASMM